MTLDGPTPTYVRNEQFEQCLLGVAAVLGLVPDSLAGSVEHFLGDLLAGVGRQAVKCERARRSTVQQRVVEP